MPEDEQFLGVNWLLDTREAIGLYHEVAVPLREDVGIVDTHTHHNLRQIVENRPFPNIWRAEVLEPREEYANNDHYIIQLAAKFKGFSQALARDHEISDYDKWMALSRVFPMLEGNHVHQWLHLDLRRMFGIDLVLDGNTGDVIWSMANKRLQEREMLPQAILKRIRARVICTTDEPSDDLGYHEMAEEIDGMSFLPTFRPDAYCNIFSDDWRPRVERICQLTGEDTTLQGLVGALRKRHEYFAQRGARASDHGLLEPYGLEVAESRVEKIFHHAYERGERYGSRSVETRDFISYMMHRFCEMNQDRGMVTQIHYGAFRNANEYLFNRWGTDVGGDISFDNPNVVENLSPLLSRFFSGKTENQSHLLLYPMNQTYAHVHVMLERAFPNAHAGFPWWHNDTPYVMEQYLLHAGGASVLTAGGGPVCDGRKILSVGSRFEVFDRVICRAIGKLISDGQMSRPGGVNAVKALMYENQKRLFRL
ncbi:MAG: glucuronate isomerase [Deltaproteobacteria bacterium]|nr:MAG: glucuronate isomerase [Deltaproteobacteria bacterium]